MVCQRDLRQAPGGEPDEGHRESKGTQHRVARGELSKTNPPFPPFDGCKPTLAPVTLLFRTPLLILLQIHVGG
jgi:hypothetical protein